MCVCVCMCGEEWEDEGILQKWPAGSYVCLNFPGAFWSTFLDTAVSGVGVRGILRMALECVGVHAGAGVIIHAIHCLQRRCPWTLIRSLAQLLI